MLLPIMLYLFLTFGIWGLCKRLQTYSKSDKGYFVGYPKSLGIPPSLYRGKGFLPQKWYAFKDNGSCKKVSGRTVQLDEITVYLSSDQRKDTLEVIPKFPTATDTEVSTIKCMDFGQTCS